MDNASLSPLHAATAPETALVERRVEDRQPMQQSVTFRCGGGHRMSAIMTDITPVGCRLLGMPDVALGEVVWVWIGTLEGRRAEVAWSFEGCVGMSFLEALHRAVVARIASLGAAPQSDPQRTAPAREAYQWQTRREQILTTGHADVPRILRAKAPRGTSMEGLIRRNTAKLVERRKEVRHPAPADATDTLLIGGVATRLEDISCSGMKIGGGIDKTIGQRVVTQFAGCEEISGRVAWKRGEWIGIALPMNSIDLHDGE